MSDMQYRTLGDSGLQVSVVGLGSWLTFGGAVGVDVTRDCVNAAVGAGINFIDTADIYTKGAAEEALGAVIPEHRRQHLVIATKAFWPMSDNVNDQGLSRKHLIESCEGSLRRLKTDYVDLYQCHRPDPNTPVREIVGVMHSLIEQGKALYWGVSCWTAAQITEAVYIARLHGQHAPIGNQPHYSMLHRKIESEILPVSSRLGVGQVVWSPLEQGILTGKYSGGVKPEGSRGADDRYNMFMTAQLTEETLAKVDRLGPIAQKLGGTVGQLAIAWTLRQPGVSAAIVGATRAEQVVENSGAAKLDLPLDVIEEIEAILDNTPEPTTGV